MEEKIKIINPQDSRPHIVLLGAGASKAAFPNGIDGRKIPIMDNLVEVIDLSKLLSNHGIGIDQNFEKIYSSINDSNLKIKIEEQVYTYFDAFVLPQNATLYDRIILSLRPKDAIFSFNWDPFLFDALVRNSRITLLPQIFFLHGNVRIGECKECHTWGRKYEICPKCNQLFVNVPLLYPIENKDYFHISKYIESCWQKASRLFSDAITLTIFGYRAPDSDIEAVRLLREAWFNKSSREAEHIEIIDIDEAASRRWGNFSPTFHLHPIRTFDESFLFRWPRRSAEAVLLAMSQGVPTKKFPLPPTDNLVELQNSVQRLIEDERTL